MYSRWRASPRAARLAIAERPDRAWTNDDAHGQSQTDTTVAARINASVRLTARRTRSSWISLLMAPPPAAHNVAVGMITRIIVIVTSTVLVNIGKVVGRNVVTAPSAKIHDFGLMTWNTAACCTPSGLAIDRSCSAPAPATCHARYRR